MQIRDADSALFLELSTEMKIDLTVIWFCFVIKFAAADTASAAWSARFTIITNRFSKRDYNAVCR